MGYTFRNTELNNEKASVFETKALLYLIGMRRDSREVEYLAIDCFNDVSGICKDHKKIWDIQSKNHSTLSPKLIGESLYTLFDNYISTFTFHEYILFTPKINPAYLIDKSLNAFKINNFNIKTFTRIKNGLKGKIQKSNKSISDIETKVDNFLNVVLLVQDDNSESDYIKKITKFKNKELRSIDFYNSVFNDLRDLQSTKKNSYIEKQTINEIKEVLKYNRFLETKQIEVLIINRIVGNSIFSIKGIPTKFYPILQGFNIDEHEDVLQECNSNLSKAFFNRNNNKHFWKVCEQIIQFVKSSGKKDVELIYNSIPLLQKPNISYLNKITINYLTGIILDGINDN